MGTFIYMYNFFYVNTQYTQTHNGRWRAVWGRSKFMFRIRFYFCSMRYWVRFSFSTTIIENVLFSLFFLSDTKSGSSSVILLYLATFFPRSFFSLKCSYIHFLYIHTYIYTFEWIHVLSNQDIYYTVWIEIIAWEIFIFLSSLFFSSQMRVSESENGNWTTYELYVQHPNI
jgi:hypothetical protein